MTRIIPAALVRLGFPAVPCRQTQPPQLTEAHRPTPRTLRDGQDSRHAERTGASLSSSQGVGTGNTPSPNRRTSFHEECHCSASHSCSGQCGHGRGTSIIPTSRGARSGRVAFTTGFGSAITGTFTKPWIGLAAGVTIGLAANLQDSNNARQNMVGGISGAVGGYLLIKTLKRDWHRKK
jgi:hypothetical protein